MKSAQMYDWAQAIWNLASSPETDLNELVAAADLDPVGGDLADVDFSGLDLSGQNLSGWNLDRANLANSKLRGTNIHGASLHDAKVEPHQIIEALEWRHA